MDVLATDDLTAERAWLAGDTFAAIEAADRALASGADVGCRAAGVAAAAAAADGALRDAAQRWRAVGDTMDGTPAVWALARAALTSALVGDVSAADTDIADARRCLPEPTPRGLAVLVRGTDAVLEALRGGFTDAARRLTGLAAATVPNDPMAVEPWVELAATVIAAAGDDRAARAMLAAATGQATIRSRLLGGWVDLRRARLGEARDALATMSTTRLLRRNAVLAAALSAGLTRRCGDAATLATTWHRVAPAVAGADVEVLLLDVWGELSVAAAHVSPTDRDSIAETMAATVARAGSPSWLVGRDAWWRVERAAVAGDRAAAADAAARLAALAAEDASFSTYADAAAGWAGVLHETVEPGAIVEVAGRLTAIGRQWEASALCGAAAAACADATAVRALHETGRTLRATGTGAAGLLSEREQEVGTLVVDGLTHKQIGARLYISPKTVEQHVARLRQKLAASNRAALVAALRTHLPTPPP